MTSPKQAIMPNENIMQKLFMMRVDDTGWVDSDALYIDMQKRCWLRRNAKIHTKHTIDSTNSVLRVTRYADGFHVWMPKERRWEPSITYEVGLPVAELHFT